MYSAGDKLPESTGDDASTLLGKLFSDRAGEILTPLGGILYSVGEHSYTLLGYIKTVEDIKPFLVLMVDKLC